MISKMTKNKAFETLFRQCIVKHTFRIKVWIFFEWHFNISFYQISNLSFYLIRTRLEKLLGKSLGKRHDV